MTDPKQLVAASRMSRMQIIAVGMCILLNALDGFDVLSISFASPGIAAEWGIDRAILGIVLSMELLGMTVGSIMLGSFADRSGRRPTILGCLILMAIGMLLSSTTDDIRMLSLYRFVTGIGIGGMLASTNAMVAEYSSALHRNLSVTLMAAGYPVGVIVGGSIASILLKHYDWRAIFIFGGLATVSFLPLVWFLLPESIEFLARKRPPRALERINDTLRRMGHRAIDSLPAVNEAPVGAGLSGLFSRSLARTTILLTVAYFAHIMTFYFMLKWIPKVVVDMGFDPSAAGGILVWANVGGASGAVLLGLLSRRINIRKLVIGALLVASIMVSAFGFSDANLQQLAAIAAIAGFFTNSAVVGLYALFVQAFPTELRAGGTGFVIGVGRGGAALGPVVAGFLFASGKDLAFVAMIMASGALIAATAIGFLRLLPRQA